MKTKKILRKSKVTKSKDTKKSQGNVVAVVLIILLCLAAVIILWKVVLPMMQGTKEEVQIRQELSKTQIGINEVSGDLVNPENDMLTISLSRGSGLTIPKEENIEVTQKSPADIASVVDVSGSMYYSEVSSCVGISDDSYCNTNPSACCCQINTLTGQRLDCSKAEDCQKCNFGTIENDPVTGQLACIFHRAAPYQCWDETANERVDYTTDAGCNKCAVFDPANIYLYTKCYWNLPINLGTGPLIKVYEQGWIGTSSALCNASGGDDLVLIPGEVASTGYQYHCIVNLGINGRCAGGHCLNIAECENNNGNWNTILDRCEITTYHGYLDPCCINVHTLGFNLIQDKCIAPAGNKAYCENTCGGTYETTAYCRYRRGKIGTSCSGNFYFDQGIGTEEGVCGVGYCYGKLNAIRKLDYARTANKNFIYNIFSYSDNHKIAIINYSRLPSSFPTSGLYDKSNEALLKQYINSFYLNAAIASSSAYQDTNICKALEAGRNAIVSEPDHAGKYKAIVLMTDGKSNAYCNGVRIIDDSENALVQDELYLKAKSIYDNDNIHIFTIGIGTGIEPDVLEKISIAGNGSSVSSDDITDLDQLYTDIADKIGSETITVYKSVQIWSSIKIVVYNDTSSYIDTITDPKLFPEILESKQIIINTGGITNINKIDIYLIVKTEDGKEISELVATWTPNTEDYDYLSSY